MARAPLTRKNLKRLDLVNDTMIRDDKGNLVPEPARGLEKHLAWTEKLGNPQAIQAIKEMIAARDAYRSNPRD